MSTQLQLRRDTAANLAGVTPVAAEPGYDETNKRMFIGDGTTQGGLHMPNQKDVITQSFISAVAGGTANAVELTFPRNPTSYQTFMRVVWKATANNTGNMTINVMGPSGLLGAVALKMINGAVLSDIPSGYISSGRIYAATYDGGVFVLEGGNSILSVRQGDLQTSVGSGSISYINSFGSGQVQVGGGVILPGGEYGFHPMIASSIGATGGVVLYNTSGGFASALGCLVGTNGGSGTYNISASWQQRYVTSSPPFSVDGREQTGFIFLKINADGTIAASYIADVPPWAYNGPTKLTASYVDQEGRKYRQVLRPSTLDEKLAGNIQIIDEVITDSQKNADMPAVPHPFLDITTGQKVVMLDASDNTQIGNLIAAQNLGDTTIADIINRGLIYPDNDPIADFKGPPGVMVCKMKIKKSR